MNLSLFNLIYGLSSNSLISNSSLFFSYIMVYLVPGLLIIWIIFFNERKIFSFSILSISAFITWFVSEIMKNISAIKRPDILNPIIVEKGFSFPSTHAAITMVIAVVMFSLNKRIGIWLVIFSILVGISRIILGVHYPIDVLAGWFVGILIGFTFIKLSNKP